MHDANCKNSHTGMALLVCLIFLTALTLLGLSAYGDTVLQNQLVANLQKSEHARQSALSALTWAEDWLLRLEGPVPDYCQKPCDGLYVHLPGELPVNPESESLSWWQAHGYETGMDPLTGGQLTGVGPYENNRSVWLIEVLHSIPPAIDGSDNLLVWYRILARGSNRSQTVVSVVESIIVRSWPLVENTVSAELDPTNTCSDEQSDTECGRVSWRELR